MNNSHLKGAAEKVAGTVKEAVGKVTGDKELQGEGSADKAKGSVHQAAGDLKDAAGKVKDALRR